MILIDANIFMYASGEPHPFKEPCINFLNRVATGEVKAGTDAEVLQEILHRYRAIRLWDRGRRVFDLARQVVDTVLPLAVETLDQARQLLDRYPALVARDAVHAAICLQFTGGAICSYDRDFDVVEGILRIEPG